MFAQCNAGYDEQRPRRGGRRGEVDKPSPGGRRRVAAGDLGVKDMTASVLVHRPVPEDSERQRNQQSADGRSSTGREHGGRQDCGCRRANCHDEFTTLAFTSDPQARTATRNRLIEAHLELAYSIARHYHRPGPGFEDIRQVAALALVEAVNRFDPDLGTAFSAFAVPTVAGAIKRHFRDHRWTVHPPRRIKELRLRLRTASDVLTQQLRRAPSVAELAEYLNCGQEDICEALCTDDALQPLSIDAPVRAADDDFTLAGTLGCADDGYARVEDLETLRPLLAELPERELRVITMRFAGNLTQSQIADRVGCSQMHVSRILRAALERMRRSLQENTARQHADHGTVPDRPDAPPPAITAVAAGAGETTDRRPCRPTRPGQAAVPERTPDPSGTPKAGRDSGPERSPNAAVATVRPPRGACPAPGPPRGAVTGRDRPPRRTGSHAGLARTAFSAPATCRPPNQSPRLGTALTTATRRRYRCAALPSRSPPRGTRRGQGSRV
jgi:RNA polymerase sigma-B factor